MDRQTNFLELLWDGLLSRHPGEVMAAFAALDSQEQEIVLVHLRRMASEPGWHPEQRASAEAALHALEDL